MRNPLDWIKDLVKQRKSIKVSELRICCNTEGLLLKADDKPEFGEVSVSWSSVQKVVAFKRDMWATDMICLAIEIPGPRTLELNEEMIDWQPFIEQLSTYLSGLPDWHEWWPKVAFPAFATNATVLYAR